MSAPVTGAISAGAARISIAPRAADLREGVWLGGFGSYRQRRAAGVRDEPWCRAVALDDGSTGLVIAALDLVGASGPLLQMIRQDAARLTGLPPDHIVLTCTHSHASPDTQGLWGGVPAGYRKYIARCAVAAIRDAWQSRASVRVTAASASLDGAVRNRRGWAETDSALTAVRFNRPDGTPVATLLNYACHPTAGGASNLDVSRDWCGYAVDAVEAAAGGVAVYVNGAVGDVVPVADGFGPAEALGASVAHAALDALAGAELVRGVITVAMRGVELPLNLDRLSERVENAVARAGFVLPALSRSGGLRAAALALHAAGRPDLAQVVAALQGMAERRTVVRDGRTFVATICGYIAIGDAIGVLVAPGEVLTRLALPLRASMAARHRVFAGLAHDTLGYFVPEDEWMTDRNSNYEESVSLGKHAGTVLADALLQLVPHGGQAPA